MLIPSFLFSDDTVVKNISEVGISLGSSVSFFFLEHAGELRIIVFIGEEKV